MSVFYVKVYDYFCIDRGEIRQEQVSHCLTKMIFSCYRGSPESCSPEGRKYHIKDTRNTLTTKDSYDIMKTTKTRDRENIKDTTDSRRDGRKDGIRNEP